MKTFATLTFAALLGVASAASAQHGPPAGVGAGVGAGAAAQGSANGVGNNLPNVTDRIQSVSPQASNTARTQVEQSTQNAVDAVQNAPGQTGDASANGAAHANAHSHLATTSTDTTASAATGAGTTDATATTTTTTGKKHKKHND